MSRKIIVPKEVSIELAKMFEVSKRAVHYALTYVSMSPRADKIRQAALQKGGQEVEIQVKVLQSAPVKPIKVLDSRGNVKRVI